MKNKFVNRMFIVLGFIFVVSCILLIGLRGTYLEYLEIGENYTEIFWIDMQYKYMGIVATFMVSFFSIYTTTVLIKKGLKQFFKEENKEMPKLPNKSISFIVSTMISIGLSGIFSEKLILLLNSTSFAINDPIFNKDIGYYMFLRPFIYMVLIYIIILIIGLAIYTALYYIVVFNKYFSKGISLETLKKNTFIKQIYSCIFIISLFIGLSFIFRSQDILFERFINLKDQSRTYLYGAGFTAVYIKVWGYRILAVLIPIAVFLAIKAFKKNERRKIAGTLISVPIYLIILFVVLTAFQGLIVKPNELGREKNYINYNIQFTKDAYGINMDEIELQNSGTITEQEMADYAEIFKNIPIVNSNTVSKTLEVYQDNTGYYIYPDINMAKHNISGEDKLIYLAPRAIVTESGRTYPDRTYKYTHGYGIIAADATSVTELGQIQYLQKDFINTDDVVNITEPRIYFGTNTTDTIITNAKNITEFDYPVKSTTYNENVYDGNAGINVNFFDRVIIGLNRAELGLMFTSNVQKDSKVIMNRDIVSRAKRVAPFLTYDENPYIVIDEDGSLKWVLDAYTTSNNYPYSQVSTIEFKDGSKERINYIRNSVKVIIDAYNGDMKFYITDRNDPLIMAYQKAYPNIFVNKDEPIPTSISKHFIYPEFLYNIQAEMLTRYHNIQSDVLFRNDDVWQYGTHNNTKTVNTSVPLNPYYTLVKENRSNEAKIGLVVPYTPIGKQNIVSYLIGKYDDDGNSKLTLYKFSAGSNVLGPMQLDTQIEQDIAISKEINDLNVAGTKVVRDMIAIPINNSILYIESIYQVAINENQVPILKKIVVASGNKVAIGNTIEEALQKLFSSAIDIEVINTDNKDELITMIVRASSNLDNSLNSGDWEMIGKDIQRLQELIQRLEALTTAEEENSTVNNMVQ